MKWYSSNHWSPINQKFQPYPLRHSQLSLGSCWDCQKPRHKNANFYQISNYKIHCCFYRISNYKIHCCCLEKILTLQGKSWLPTIEAWSTLDVVFEIHWFQDLFIEDNPSILLFACTFWEILKVACLVKIIDSFVFGSMLQKFGDELKGRNVTILDRQSLKSTYFFPFEKNVNVLLKDY